MIPLLLEVSDCKTDFSFEVPAQRDWICKYRVRFLVDNLINMEFVITQFILNDFSRPRFVFSNSNRQIYLENDDELLKYQSRNSGLRVQVVVPWREFPCGGALTLRSARDGNTMSDSLKTSLE